MVVPRRCGALNGSTTTGTPSSSSWKIALGDVVEAEAVLEAGAPATLDRDSQDERLVRLLGEEILDLRRRDRRERDQRLTGDVNGMLDSRHGRMVADEGAGSRAEFVTLVSRILRGNSHPFVRRKGEC